MVTRLAPLWNIGSYRQVTNLYIRNVSPSRFTLKIERIEELGFTLTPPLLTATARHDQSLCEPTREGLLTQWPNTEDLWIFGYASLIWRPEFEVLESHITKVQGWHRALKMWSRVNRGSPECPGLVFALLSGGSCQGKVFRTPATQVSETIEKLWYREMPNSVYIPRWLQCPTPKGPVTALAFTLPRNSPNFTGELSPEQYKHIFKHAKGRYGSTLDYALETFDSLKQHGIKDKALAALLEHAKDRP
jgi:glutathione-specific gamma-glutamylcyclotransferase